MVRHLAEWPNGWRASKPRRRRWKGTLTPSDDGRRPIGEGGPRALIFEQTGGIPPALGEAQREELRAAVQRLPAIGGHGPGQLELEGGASVCLGMLWPQRCAAAVA